MDSEQGQVIIPIASLSSGQELRGWFPVTPIDARSSSSTVSNSSIALGRSGRLAADTLAALGLTTAHDSSDADATTATAATAASGSSDGEQRQHRRTDNNTSSNSDSRAEILLRVQLVPKPVGAAVTEADIHASSTIEAMLSKVCAKHYT
jgi:hypothetical protein